MIEGGRTPSIRVVTGSAFCAKTAGVRVILKMAGGTVRWCIFKLGVLVTIRTRGAGMFTVQFEGKLGVIYMGRLPSIRRMTGGAVCAKAAGVRVILKMARGAVHWSAFEDTVLMTTFASHGGM